GCASAPDQRYLRGIVSWWCSMPGRRHGIFVTGCREIGRPGSEGQGSERHHYRGSRRRADGGEPSERGAAAPHHSTGALGAYSALTHHGDRRTTTWRIAGD